MKPSEILDGAADLIATPDKWTQGESATDLHGDRVASYSHRAVCWCALGALGAMTAGREERAVAREFLRSTIGSRSVVHWNDFPERTHTEVLAAFRGAANLAREASQ